MPRSPDRLTTEALERLTSRAKPYKVADGGGMFVEVHPNGGRYWRLKYRYGGKEKRLALGVYPAVTLEEAREARAHVRELLAAGKDPAAQRRAKRPAPPPLFMLSWGDGGELAIHADGQLVRLAPIRVRALRAFLETAEA